MLVVFLAKGIGQTEKCRGRSGDASAEPRNCSMYLLEMFPPDVFLDIGANVHGGVATRPGTLIYDAHMLSLKQKEREMG